MKQPVNFCFREELRPWPAKPRGTTRSGALSSNGRVGGLEGKGVGRALL